MELVTPKTALIPKLAVICSILCLFFSITNVVPFSALMFIFVIFIPVILFSYNTHHKIAISVSAMLAYFLISTLFYSPKALLNYDFLRRDGNVFITFAPLLILAFIKAKVDTDKIVKIFIKFATIINFLFVLVFYATGGTIFFYEQGIYHFLFEAHNAAGGFLAMLTALSVGYYFGTKQKLYLFASLFNTFTLYISDSRGSILALAVAVLLVVIFKGNKEKLAVKIVIISQIIILGYLYQNKAPLYLVEANSFTVEGKTFSFEDYIHRSGTIVNRGLYLWPRAMHQFFQSPIFGTGFGSYNDMLYDMEGIRYVFMFNANTNKVFNDAHAHHSFLHIAAETGVVGLALILLTLRKIRKYIGTLKSNSLGLAMHIAYWVAILSSLTEHRLFTPSQMLPFVIILGLSIAANRYNQSLKETDFSQNGK